MKLPENLWLILHKVRGEPAWDVAEAIDLGEEKGWIIPTSGHRAYPLVTLRLGQLLEPGELTDLDGFAALRDHYTVNAAPAKPKASLAELLGTNGEPSPGFTRRI